MNSMKFLLPYTEAIFETRDEAERLIDEIKTVLETNSFLTMKEVKEMVSVTPNFSDEYHGFTKDILETITIATLDIPKGTLYMVVY